MIDVDYSDMCNLDDEYEKIENEDHELDKLLILNNKEDDEIIGNLL